MKYSKYFVGGITAGAVAAILAFGSVQAHDLDARTPIKPIYEIPPAAQNMTAKDAGAMGAIVNAYKLWQAGAVLTACFMGGTQELRRFFADTEREWEAVGNLKWDFGSEPAYRDCDPQRPSHIRIAFANVGNWSYVGTDSIRADLLAEPSLNIGDASAGNTSLVNRTALRGVMLHEQGHAAGWEHEHQSPSDPCIRHIRWAVVYKEMAEPPNLWDSAKVDQNLRALVETDRLRYTNYDPHSIMHYTFPARWFDTSTCAAGPNYELSEIDKELMRAAYPETAQDQAKFITGLNTKAKSAAEQLRLSSEDQTALQKDIDDIGSKLSNELKDTALRKITGVGSTNVISMGPYGQGAGVNTGTMNQTSGNCASIVSQNPGPVTITSDCPK
jgi:hypothetical protein